MCGKRNYNYFFIFFILTSFQGYSQSYNDFSYKLILKRTVNIIDDDCLKKGDIVIVAVIGYSDNVFDCVMHGGICGNNSFNLIRQ